ncbi:MAG: OmpA family protein, partial [Bradyrhizobium sp.]
MHRLRLLLLATTALSAMQFASPASHAQTASQSTPQLFAPQLLAQAEKEGGPNEKEKKGGPPKGGQPPAKGAPPLGKEAPRPPAPPAP